MQKGFTFGLEIGRFPGGHRALAIVFTERSMARLAQIGPPALGLHLLMGEATKTMLENVFAGLRQSLLDPIELYARAV